MVAGCIGVCGWRCRHIAAGDVDILPTIGFAGCPEPATQSPVADKLADMSIDRNCNIGWQSNFYPGCIGNVVVTTDGGYTPSSGVSSGGWAIFLCSPETNCLILLDIACVWSVFVERKWQRWGPSWLRSNYIFHVFQASSAATTC